jgi:hypothetical protein
MSGASHRLVVNLVVDRAPARTRLLAERGAAGRVKHAKCLHLPGCGLRWGVLSRA